MTGVRGAPCVLAGVAWLIGALAAGPGCDTPAPPAPIPQPPEVPAEPPEDPLPVVARCEGATIRAIGPRWIGEESCLFEAYEVDFVVEGRPADAMLLDMFQSHVLWNWRVEEIGGAVRHEFTLRLKPGWTASDVTPPGIQSHEPLVLQRCPEGDGEGWVLACGTERCGVYDDVSQVPPLTPRTLDLAITVPNEANYRIPLREGEAVEIPYTFRIYRPLPADVRITFGLRFPIEQFAQFADVEFGPDEFFVAAGSSRTETRVLWVTATRFDHQGFQERPHGYLSVPFSIVTNTHWDAGCLVPRSNGFRFELFPPEETGLARSPR